MSLYLHLTVCVAVTACVCVRLLNSCSSVLFHDVADCDQLTILGIGRWQSVPVSICFYVCFCVPSCELLTELQLCSVPC